MKHGTGISLGLFSVSIFIYFFNTKLYLNTCTGYGEISFTCILVKPNKYGTPNAYFIHSGGLSSPLFSLLRSSLDPQRFNGKISLHNKHHLHFSWNHFTLMAAM